MPGAELQLAAADGTALPAGAPNRISKTVAEWSLSLPPGAESRITIAPPDHDVLEPYFFAALADVQEALPSVQDIYSRLNEDPSLRFVIFAGDLTSNGSEEQLAEFKERMKGLDIPIFATVGNHELFTNTVPYQRYFGRVNYSFRFKGAHFTLIDTGDATVDPLAVEWLDGWLRDGKDAVHVFASHIAFFDPTGTRNGAFSNRAEAAALLEKLASHGVDLTLYGHVHSYYAFSNASIPAYISGGGGAIPEQFDGVGRHYLKIELNPRVGVRQVSLVRVD
jgi:3',5'-cyclic-AMP phosphodiesterase